MGLSFPSRQTVQFKKNRTAGLSQSNARKKQWALQTSQSVLPKNILLADGGLLANTNWLLVAVNVVLFC